jgi:hypothetical protein
VVGILNKHSGRRVGTTPLAEADDNVVIAIELDPDALVWVDEHPASERVIPVIGDASNEAATERTADLVQESGTLSGWVKTRERHTCNPL